MTTVDRLLIPLKREKKMARTRSIKVLDFAMSAEGEGAATCALFVEALGLKTLFPAFMGKVGSQKLELYIELISILLRTTGRQERSCVDNRRYRAYTRHPVFPLLFFGI